MGTDRRDLGVDGGHLRLQFILTGHQIIVGGMSGSGRSLQRRQLALDFGQLGLLRQVGAPVQKLGKHRVVTLNGEQRFQ